MSHNYIRPLTFRKFQFFTAAAALLLSLTLFTDAFASLGGGNPNITNGEFGTPGACSLTGWGTTGDVSLTTAGVIGGTGSVEASNDCVAKLQAINNLGTATVESTISQSITVPAVSATNPDATRLCVYAWPNKVDDTGQATGLTQTIALFTPFTSIYSKTNSLMASPGATFRFTYDLSAYAGEDVTLKATVRVPRSRTEFYATLLSLDNIRFGDDATCGSQANHNW